MRFVYAISNRSVYTSGTATTGAGLTCAAVRDESTNELYLEAGALVLADLGVCCIDEFGCMRENDKTTLHEAMEQQTISVAKGGITAKLNTRTTIVAAMNPVGGRYDRLKSFEENSALSTPLTSRFDLIFLMVDENCDATSEACAYFLLQNAIKAGSAYERPPKSLAEIDEDESGQVGDNESSHWTMERLRAYIAYVQRRFRPKLSAEASNLLSAHYTICRQHSGQHNEQSLATVRLLESLIRLAQAHARLMHRDTVEPDDAVAVILLLQCTAIRCDRYGIQFDKNPVTTGFAPFDEADALFEQEKDELLDCMYYNNSYY